MIDAFRDVQAHWPTASGCATRPKSYRNDIIPRARGDAVRIKQEAEAYRQEIIARSQGDADRFVSVYRAFKAAQDVTSQRLYLETMEAVLKSSNKVIIDKSAQGSSGVLPYLPLPALGLGGETTGAPAAGAGSGTAAHGPGATPSPSAITSAPSRSRQ